MASRAEQLIERLDSTFGGELSASIALGEVSMDVPAAKLVEVATLLQSDPALSFTLMLDLCGVDYSAYGVSEWETETRAAGGFSRAVDSASVGRLTFGSEARLPNSDRPRFAAVYHLLSIEHNVRLRLRCFAEDDDFPVVPSVTGIWACADWYEREAFDLFGILFEGHNDLRRILTDYGFIGHPFRKDFPLIGNVEMRFDPEKGRVVYEPVSIEPRVLVPRVIRSDSRYATGQETDSTAQDNAEQDS